VQIKGKTGSDEFSLSAGMKVSANACIPKSIISTKLLPKDEN
jgi:hypothetical protein